MNPDVEIQLLFGVEFRRAVLGMFVKQPDSCKNCIYRKWKICPCGKCNKGEEK